jgi:hypothetical protein
MGPLITALFVISRLPSAWMDNTYAESWTENLCKSMTWDRDRVVNLDLTRWVEVR